jgi:hypothetical protein
LGKVGKDKGHLAPNLSSDMASWLCHIEWVFILQTLSFLICKMGS